MNLIKYVGVISAVEAGGLSFKRGIPVIVPDAELFAGLSDTVDFAVSSIAELESLQLDEQGNLIAAPVPAVVVAPAAVAAPVIPAAPVPAPAPKEIK